MKKKLFYSEVSQGLYRLRTLSCIVTVTTGTSLSGLKTWYNSLKIPMVSSLSHRFSDSCLIDLVNYAKMYLQMYYMSPQTHTCQTKHILWCRLIKLPTPAVEHSTTSNLQCRSCRFCSKGLQCFAHCPVLVVNNKQFGSTYALCTCIVFWEKNPQQNCQSTSLLCIWGMYEDGHKHLYSEQ